jgi:hypothetical protein
MTQGEAIEAEILWPALHQVLPGLAGGSGRGWRQFAGVAS